MGLTGILTCVLGGWHGTPVLLLRPVLPSVLVRLRRVWIEADSQELGALFITHSFLWFGVAGDIFAPVSLSNTSISS